MWPQGRYFLLSFCDRILRSSAWPWTPDPLKYWGYRLIFQIMPIFKKVQSKNPVEGPNLGSEELGVLCCQCFWQLGSEWLIPAWEIWVTHSRTTWSGYEIEFPLQQASLFWQSTVTSGSHHPVALDLWTLLLSTSCFLLWLCSSHKRRTLVCICLHIHTCTHM